MKELVKYHQPFIMENNNSLNVQMTVNIFNIEILFFF